MQLLATTFFSPYGPQLFLGLTDIYVLQAYLYALLTANSAGYVHMGRPLFRHSAYQ